jgi:nitrogen-specific signal transduction histidine kinase
VLDSIGEAVIVADAMGFILAMNPAAEALLHGVAAELKDTPIEQVLPILGGVAGGDSKHSFTHSLECAWKGTTTAFDHARRAFRVDVSASPIVDKENGSTTGVVFVLREQ